jgi:DNA-binding CsgD family transcriptional regulator
MSITLEAITAKVRASRPIYNMKGERIELTNMQRSMVRYICRHGYSYKEIAREIGESLHVVKHQVAQALRLSGCRNQGQFGVWAERQRLV